eukprot:5061578-Amphidinium_carterae.1
MDASTSPTNCSLAPSAAAMDTLPARRGKPKPELDTCRNPGTAFTEEYTIPGADNKTQAKTHKLFDDARLYNPAANVVGAVLPLRRGAR